MGSCGGIQAPRRLNRGKVVILTMVLVWVVYTAFFRVSSRGNEEGERSETGREAGGTWPLQAADAPFSSSPSTSSSPKSIPLALVVPSTENDDTSWLFTHFPDWRKYIYAVDDRNAELTVPLNKGRESMTYLT